MESGHGGGRRAHGAERFSSLRRPALALALSLVGAVALAACGGDGNGGGTEPEAGGFGGSLDAESFSVLLVVGESGADVIDHIEVFCGPGGQISGSGTIAEDVPIDDGSFSAESEEASIEGEFVSATQAEGEIQALSDNATGCGVPSEGTSWTAECRLGEVEAKEPEDVEPGGLIIGTAYATGSGGTEVVSFGAESVSVSTGACGTGTT